MPKPRNAPPKRIMTPQGTFASARAAAKAAGIRVEAAGWRARNRRLGWRYLRDPHALALRPSDPHAGRPVIGPDGTRHGSGSAAARAAGVSVTTMQRWCAARRGGWRWEDQGPEREGVSGVPKAGPVT